MKRFQISDFKSQIYKFNYLVILCRAVCCLIIGHLLFAGLAYSQGLVVMAKKVIGDLPLDPKDAAWGKAVPLDVPLAPQVMAKPRIYESKIKELKVRALHNTKEIAFVVEWEDPTEDSIVDIDKFSDAVALEFPSQTSKEKPHFAMGDKENTVNIWFWKAAWQKAEEEGRLYAMVDDLLEALRREILFQGSGLSLLRI